MSNMPRLVWMGGAMVAGIAARAPAQAAFMGLGSLPGYGDSFQATMSADGQWVVGTAWNTTTNASVAFRWSAATGMQDIRTVIGVFAPHAVISPDGVALTGHHVNAEDEDVAFRWRSSDGLRDLGHLVFDISSFGNAVSNNGSVVIGEGDSSFSQFRWTEQTGIQPVLPLVSGDLLILTAVSADGMVIVGAEDPGIPGTVRAVRLVQGTGLEALPAIWPYAEAKAVSSDGAVIAGSVVNNSDSVPCLWVQGDGPRLLDRVAGWNDSRTTAISGDGATVVGSGTGATSSGSFLWRQSLGAVDLRAYLARLGADLKGWGGLYPTGLSADGRTIVGSGTHAGHDEVWVAHLAAPACYANCDGSTGTPALNAADFMCFFAAFAAGDPFANCDQSTAPPALNVLDFMCFLNRFAAGCS